jgi:hypothetical protein
MEEDVARQAEAAGMSEQLQFHPLADIFPLMEGEELDALVADIKKYGVREKIVLYEGKILDGRNRYRALQRLEGFPNYMTKGGGRIFTLGNVTVDRSQITDPVAYVVSKNVHRRHLTPEKKLEVIASLIKANPEKSDRQIAEQAKASPTTVGKKRAEMEEKGEVSKLDTRTDRKGVKQPAKKRKQRRKLESGTADEAAASAEEAAEGGSDRRDGNGAAASAEPEDKDEDWLDLPDHDDRERQLRAFVNIAEGASLDARKTRVEPVTAEEWQSAIKACRIAAAAWTARADELERAAAAQTEAAA